MIWYAQLARVFPDGAPKLTFNGDSMTDSVSNRYTVFSPGSLYKIVGIFAIIMLVYSQVPATPSAFSFLTLGDKFAAATDEAQPTLLLAAGEALIIQVIGPAQRMWY
jgi:hypothetical protein